MHRLLSDGAGMALRAKSDNPVVCACERRSRSLHESFISDGLFCCFFVSNRHVSIAVFRFE